MINEEGLFVDLITPNDLIYDKCGLVLTKMRQHLEGAEYGACSFELNGHKIEHRTSKITPTKNGQFVTLWKRNKGGKTEPLDVLDSIDFVIITSKDDGKIGQFVFPKSVLLDQGVISKNNRGGKRGIRVYPPWVVTTSRQAEATQRWQTKYFVLFEDSSGTNSKLIELLNSGKADAT